MKHKHAAQIAGVFALFSIAVYALLFLLRAEEGASRVVGIFHHQLHYIVHSSVLSTFFTEPLYGTQFLFHPYFLLLRLDFVFLGALLVGLIVYFLVLLLCELRFKTGHVFISVLTFLLIGGLLSLAFYNLLALLSLTISLVCLYLLLQPNRLLHRLGIGLLILFSLVDTFGTIIVLVFWVMLRKQVRQSRSKHIVVGSAAFLSLLIGALFFSYSNGLFVRTFSFPWFYELGYYQGVSGWLFLIGICFAFLLWDKSLRNWYVLAFVLFAMSFVHLLFAAVFYLLLCVLFAYFLRTIGQQRWVFDFSKTLLVVAVICSTLLSFILFVQQFSGAPADANDVALVDFIASTELQTPAVLTSPGTLALLEKNSVARGVFPSFENVFGQRRQLSLNTSIFVQYDEDIFISELRNVQVQYIIIDPRVDDFIQYNSNSLLFNILENSAHFSQVYSSQKYRVYAVYYE